MLVCTCSKASVFVPLSLAFSKPTDLPCLCHFAGQTSLKKSAELFFPPEFADDFPVSLQISERFGLVYVITKLGLLFVYDLETAAAIYRTRISPDPIFLAAPGLEVRGWGACVDMSHSSATSKQPCMPVHSFEKPTPAIFWLASPTLLPLTPASMHFCPSRMAASWLSTAADRSSRGRSTRQP